MSATATLTVIGGLIGVAISANRMSELEDKDSWPYNREIMIAPYFFLTGAGIGYCLGYALDAVIGLL